MYFVRESGNVGLKDLFLSLQAILIDPSAFIAHFEMMREPGNGAVSAPNSTVPPEAANTQGKSCAWSHNIM